MPKSTARGKTPDECIAGIVRAAMADAEVTQEQLAKRVNVHKNTVYRDLLNPETMTLGRMQLYFAALGVPVRECLIAFAGAYAQHLALKDLEGF